MGKERLLPQIGHVGHFKMAEGIRVVHLAALDWAKMDFLYPQFQKQTPKLVLIAI